MSTSPGLARRRGFTLVEIMVSAFLSLLLLTVLFQVFTLTARVGKEELGRNGAEASAMVFFKKLQTDFLRTTSSGISLTADGHRTTFHPIRSVTDERQLTFEDKLIYWSFDPSQELLTRSELLSPPLPPFEGVAYRMPMPDLLLQPLTGSSQFTNRLQNVTEFSILNPSNVAVPNVGSLLTIRMAVDNVDAENRKSFRFDKKIRLRTTGG